MATTVGGGPGVYPNPLINEREMAASRSAKGMMGTDARPFEFPAGDYFMNEMERSHAEQDTHTNFRLPKPGHLSDKAYESIVHSMKEHRDRERKQVQYKNESLRKLDLEFAEHLNELVGIELVGRYVADRRRYQTETPAGEGLEGLDLLADQLGL